MNNKRVLYLDMLKIISCIAVVLIHVTADGFNLMNINTASWSVVTALNVLVKFAVPMFVMVSGALFLNPDRKLDVKKLWKKNILNLVIVYIIWTLIYATYVVYNKGQGINFMDVLSLAVKNSHYHLWFIPMLIGIYACIPLLKPMVSNGKRTVEYLLILFTLLYILPNTIEHFKFPYYTFVKAILDRIQVPMLGYIGYFVLGHYLHMYGIPKKYTKLVYVSGIVSAVVGIVVTWIYSWHMGKATTTLASNFSITTYIISIMIFVLMKNLFENKKLKFEKQIIHLSNISLGIYLIHVLIIDVLINRLDMPFTNIWNLPLNIVILLVVSYLISLGLSKIPFVNKYII